MNVENSYGRRKWAQTTTWILASNVIRNLATISIIVLLARLTNSTTLGEYALALAITTPIFAFFQFGLKGVYLTLKVSTLFTSFLIFQTIFLLVAVAISLIISIFTSPGLLGIIFLVSLIKCNDAYSEILSGPLQKFGKPSLIFWAYSVSSIVGTLLVAASLFAGFSLIFSLSLLAFTSFVTTLLMLLRQAINYAQKNQEPSSEISRNKELLIIFKAGLPTGVAAAVLSLVVTIPQYQVAVAAGSSAVGYLAVILYGLAVVDIFLGTLSQTWIPRAQKLLRDSNKDNDVFGTGLVKSVFLWTLIMIPIATSGVLLMSIIYPPLLGAEFAISIGISIPLFIAIVLSPAQHFAGVGLVVLNRYSIGVIPSIFAASASALVGFILIEVMNLAAIGAMWAIAVALAVRGLITLLLALPNKNLHTKENIE